MGEDVEVVQEEQIHVATAEFVTRLSPVRPIGPHVSSSFKSKLKTTSMCNGKAAFAMFISDDSKQYRNYFYGTLFRIYGPFVIVDIKSFILI